MTPLKSECGGGNLSRIREGQNFDGSRFGSSCSKCAQICMIHVRNSPLKICLFRLKIVPKF